MRRILYLALTASMIAGCSEENDLGDKRTEYEVKITSGIASRASGTTWRTDDRVGIYMSGNSNGDILATNIEYRNTAADGATATFEAVESSQTLYYPDNTPVNFIAYYPYSNNVGARAWEQLMDRVHIDLSNQNDLSAIDLMIAKIENVDKTTNPLNFTFKHCLSNVKLTLKVARGVTIQDLEGVKVRITGTYPWTQLILQNENLVTPTAGPAPIDIPQFIDPTNPSQRIAEAIVAPRERAYKEVKFEFDVPNHGTLIADVPDGTIHFEPGKRYEYAITLWPWGVTMTSVNITPWRFADDDNGTASQIVE